MWHASGCDRLCRAASFPPALFLALLQRQEQLSGPSRRELIIGDGRDTDACAPQPEMCEDALATFPTLRDALHNPAPYLWRGSRRPRGAELCTRVKVGARRAKRAHTAMWARRTLTVCDNANSGQQVIACSRCEQSPEARQSAVCDVVEKRKLSVDVNQCV